MSDKNLFWNEAGKDAIILAAVTAAFFFLSMWMQTVKVPAIVAGLISGILWLGKFVGCIWLLKVFLKKNGNEFKFGCAVAFLSALVFSGIQLAYIEFINPEYFEKAIQTALNSYSSMLDSNSLNAIDELMPKLPAITFFTNLAYCSLFGIVVSAIITRSSSSANPFEQK